MMDDDDSSEQDEGRRGGSAFRRPVMLRPKKDLNQSASDADLPSLQSSVSTSPAEHPPSQPPIPATMMAQRGVPLLPNTPEVSKPLLKSINLNFKGMTLQDK
jgi:hypothetical protein